MKSIKGFNVTVYYNNLLVASAATKKNAVTLMIVPTLSLRKVVNIVYEFGCVAFSKLACFMSWSYWCCLSPFPASLAWDVFIYN